MKAKKSIAYLICLMMIVVSMIPAYASAETVKSAKDVQLEQQIDQTAGGRTPVTGFNEDGVAISKTISPTGVENYFDITLGVTTEEVVEQHSTAIVLVLDVSNTMNSGTRLHDAKEAAKKFVEDYAKEKGISSAKNLGIVTFNTDARWAKTMTTVSESNYKSIQSSIDKITAPRGDTSSTQGERFTNIEGGLQLAYNKMNTLDVKHKYVILITDGFPTTYIKTESSSNRTNASTIKGYDPYETEAWDSKKVGKDGYFCDAANKAVCSYGTSYSDKAAKRAQEVAESTIKKNNINICSIGIALGAQSMDSYLGQAKNGVYVVDRGNTSASKLVIGNTKNSYISWLRDKVAGGPDVNNDNDVRYSNGDNLKNLNYSYKKILANIKSVSSISISKAYVTDPMGKNIEFKEFLNKGSNTVIYDKAKDSFNWDLDNSPYVKKTEGNKTVYYYELKYRIRLENEAKDFVDNSFGATNGKTTLDYTVTRTDSSGGGSTSENSITVDFKVPKNKGYLGKLVFVKADTKDNSKVLQGAEFMLKHKDTCSVCGGNGKVNLTDRSVTSDESGKVAFSKLPSGHDYILTETKAPEGYKLDTAAYPVKIEYGKTSILINGSWVAANKVDNNAVVGNDLLKPAFVDLKAIKTVDGQAPEENEKFSFILKNADGEKLQTVTNDGSSVSFERLKFDEPGTYEYTIEEKAGEGGYIFDGMIYDIEIEVKAPNTAGMDSYIAAVSVGGKPYEANAETPIKFNNLTIEPAVITFSADKNLEGKAPEGEYVNEFTFQLSKWTENEDGDLEREVVSEAKNGDGGRIVFEELRFNREGTYYYSINEKRGADANIIYDEIIYNVRVDVTLDDSPQPLDEKSHKPRYVARATIIDDITTLSDEAAAPSEEMGTVEFNNEFVAPAKAQITAKKQVADARTSIKVGLGEGDIYTFELKDENGEVIGTVQNDMDGNIVFDEIEYPLEEKTYNYTISEVIGNEKFVTYDETVYNVKVKVTLPEGAQSYVAEVEYEEEPVFVNKIAFGMGGGDDPDATDTGDHSCMILWAMMAITSLMIMILIYIMNRKKVW